MTRLDDALEDCLARVEAGATPEEALARHGEEADALRPLLEAALALRGLPPLPQPSRDVSRAALAKLSAERYPPTADGPTPSLAPAVAVALVVGAVLFVVGVLVWLEVRSATVSPSQAPTPAVTSAAGELGGRPGEALSDAAVSPSMPGMSGTRATTAASAAGEPTADSGSSPVGGEITASPRATLGAGTPPKRRIAVPVPTRVTESAPAAPATALAVQATTIEGQVVDGKGRGIADALVKAFRDGATSFYVQRTDEGGRYRILVAPGRFRLRAEADGHASQWFAGAAEATGADLVEARSGTRRTEVDFTLSATARNR